MKCLLCGKNTDILLTDTLRGGLKGKVFFCKSCELGMLENNQSEKAIADFYKNKYRNHHLYKESSSPQELFDIYVNFQDRRIDLLKKYLHKNTRLLEVGCSVGMFLYHAKKYTDKIIGIDYDLKSSMFARAKCQCVVLNNDIKNTSLPKKSFDIICMFQVLEHVKDPIRFIAQHKKYLKPGGRIVIEVPNINNALRSAYDLPNYAKFHFHPAHLWYFSEKSLGILMDNAGFNGDIIFTQTYNLLNNLHWIDTDTPQKSCVPGMSTSSFPLRKDFDGGALDGLICSMDSMYKKMLAMLKITDNITYIGKKNG